MKSFHILNIYFLVQNIKMCHKVADVLTAFTLKCNNATFNILNVSFLVKKLQNYESSPLTHLSTSTLLSRKELRLGTHYKHYHSYHCC
jgi:hypothetical protein